MLEILCLNVKICSIFLQEKHISLERDGQFYQMTSLFLTTAASHKLRTGWSKDFLKILDENKLVEITAAVKICKLLEMTYVIIAFINKVKA